MIKLSLNKKDIENLNRQITMKVEAIGYMTSPDYLQEVSRAAFCLLGERFMLAVDRFAASNPKAMHHVYEWKRVGNPSQRLFILNQTRILGGTFTTEISFKQSRTVVPVDPELLIPGKTGKVITRKNVFRDKARMMELGMPVSFQAKRMLAFMGRDGIRFIRPGEMVYIRNPGGNYTKNSLGSFMSGWYNRNAQQVMDSSGLYERIAEEAARVLSKDNTDMIDVKKATIKVVNAVVAGREQIK